MLEDDGGVLSAVVNAASLALADACIEMRDYPVSCILVCVHDNSLLSMNRAYVCVKILMKHTWMCVCYHTDAYFHAMVDYVMLIIHYLSYHNIL